MEAENITEQLGNENLHKNKIHRILAHSYLFYFILFLVGFLLDFFYHIKIFEEFDMTFLGVIFLIFGSILVFWAQKSSHNFKKENLTKEIFLRGPYRYTRTPTHFGLFLLMLGFGSISNALFIIIFSVISFIFTKFVFIKEEEKILAVKYGTPYLEYKEAVKF